MICNIRKTILTQMIKSQLQNNFLFTKPIFFVNKKQCELVIKHLLYSDYVDIQNFYYLDNSQQNIIINNFLKRFSSYDKGYFNERSIKQFINHVNKIILDYDISLHNSNSFFYSEKYKNMIEQIQLQECKNKDEIYYRMKEEQTQRDLEIWKIITNKYYTF